MGKRFVTEFISTLPDETISLVAQDFFAKEGFSYTEYNGEMVWKKGVGALTAPQFIKLEFQNSRVRIHAWLKWAILPGVYCGEMGLTGFWGFAVKQMLKGRVDNLIALLTQNNCTSYYGTSYVPQQAPVQQSAQNVHQTDGYQNKNDQGQSQNPYQSQAENANSQQQAVGYSENPQQPPQQAQQFNQNRQQYNQQSYPYNQQMYNPQPVAVHNPTAKATVSLIMGLVSIITWIIPLLGVTTSIIGIVFAVPGLKSTGRGKAIAGLILSIIFLCVSLLMWIYNIIVLSAANNLF